MRNPNRIYPICLALAECWSRVPEWRFMQLISNFQREIGQDGFYLEDEEFIEKLKDYTNMDFAY